MSNEDKGKILIMGTGGCGSSFIWGLLGDLGFDNGGINEFMRYGGVREAVKCGNLHDIKFPQIIKHLGGFLTNLNEHIDRHQWKIWHIFFCVASYEFQIKTYVKRRRHKQKELTKEERVSIADKDYRNALGSGLIQLIEYDRPFTIIRCPRSIKDPKYCYDKLKPILNISYEEFLKVHQARIDPRLFKRLKKWD